ncbi:MAG: hypothetical protein ACE37F_37040 [Nannocystaceae bacterium]|nr:hypothetical protein [bacterium]
MLLGLSHFTTGYFVLDPARALVSNDGFEIPLEELRVPRITSETTLETAGEFGELVQEVRGEVIKCGTHVFFRQASFRRRDLEKIASALNDAIREYDERDAVRRWLEQAGRDDD